MIFIAENHSSFWKVRVKSVYCVIENFIIIIITIGVAGGGGMLVVMRW
jgi:hypothetical protein